MSVVLGVGEVAEGLHVVLLAALLRVLLAVADLALREDMDSLEFNYLISLHQLDK